MQRAIPLMVGLLAAVSVAAALAASADGRAPSAIFAAAANDSPATAGPQPGAAASPAALAAAPPAPAPAAAPAGGGDIPLAQLAPSMALEQVRVGMKGYGLTVFHGVAIEPFPVEVISVMRDFSPQHGVVWIRCPDERMQKSGPVQGMSGSPIYLWDDEGPHELGQGGKLIGAFAFGFGESKDCYVGVQPIAYMRETASRANLPQPVQRAAATGEIGQTLTRLLHAAGQQGVSPRQSWRTELLRRAFIGPGASAAGAAAADGKIPGEMSLAVPPAPANLQGQCMPLQLPLALGSPALAKLLTPLLQPLGISPLAAPAGGVVGKPPVGIEAAAVKMAAGSVITIPLAYGDLDLSASGTVTEVWPDGRVLAFGHAMFGQGRSALPVASGFVHMVIPSNSISFKLSGSAALQGALVRDEPAGIVAQPGGHYDVAPVTVTVQPLDQPERKFHYQVAQHRMLGPIIASLVTAQSVVAYQDLPPENHVRLKAHMVFEGNRVLDFENQTPNAAAAHMFMDLAPALSAMAQNQHDSLRLTAMDVHVQVLAQPQLATLVNGYLDAAEVKPGGKLGITVRLQPYGKAVESQRVELAIPPSLQPGQYNVMICDAQTYMNLWLSSRPYLMNTGSVDDVLALLKRVFGASGTGYYVVMQLPEQGLAVGRSELPNLPSSRRALIASPVSTVAASYNEWLAKAIPGEQVISGSLNFAVQVSKDAAP